MLIYAFALGEVNKLSSSQPDTSAARDISQFLRHEVPIAFKYQSKGLQDIKMQKQSITASFIDAERVLLSGKIGDLYVVPQHVIAAGQ